MSSGLWPLDVALCCQGSVLRTLTHRCSTVLSVHCPQGEIMNLMTSSQLTLLAITSAQRALQNIICFTSIKLYWLNIFRSINRNISLSSVPVLLGPNILSNWIIGSIIIHHSLSDKIVEKCKLLISIWFLLILSNIGVSSRRERQNNSGSVVNVCVVWKDLSDVRLSFPSFGV